MLAHPPGIPRPFAFSLHLCWYSMSLECVNSAPPQ